MKFKLICTSDYKLHDRYINKLCDAGYTVEDVICSSIKDDCCYITLSSLEELIKIKDILKEELIICNDYYNDELTIEIYDEYRE